jgi:hypothetical protein
MNAAYCDGIRRRDFLRVGTLGATGLTLAGYLRMAQAGEVDPHAKAKAGILIYLTGGPSHMDTFDLKPDAPAEFRGEFNPIDTNVSGVRISEHLPKLAQCAEKYAILRGVSHTLAAHELGKMYMNTGNRPLPSLVYPSYSAVVSKEMEGSPELPKTVAVPNPTHPAGFLGVAHSPLSTGTTPRQGLPFTVRGTSLRAGITEADVGRRQDLLNDLDTTFKGYEEEIDLIGGLDRFSEQAYNIISSKTSRKAFDVGQESKAVQEAFGADPFGQSCLLAVRLVQSGVRFVTVNLGGWDTHQDNFTRLKDGLLPKLDIGVAALLTQLAERGLLESTSVMVTGEFGRTPKINPRVGRDHWPRAMFVLMAGGGMRGGQVIGASDEKGQGPAADAITPDHVAASFYHSLGIDFTKEYDTASGRPIMIVRDGNLIRPQFG